MEHLGWGWLAGSLAEDGESWSSAALVEHGYSMIWSALRSSVCGMVRPSALALEVDD
jgi:hypothetical protein